MARGRRLRGGGENKRILIANIASGGTAAIEHTHKHVIGDSMEATIERQYQENHKPLLLDGEGEAQLTMLALFAATGRVGGMDVTAAR